MPKKIIFTEEQLEALTKGIASEVLAQAKVDDTTDIDDIESLREELGKVKKEKDELQNQILKGKSSTDKDETKKVDENDRIKNLAKSIFGK